jgi:hypothetical protein
MEARIPIVKAVPNPMSIITTMIIMIILVRPINAKTMTARRIIIAVI